jgi:putative peptidoglycan lipid II flippase
MSQVLHKKSIMKKTIQIGSSTLISRFLGIIREYLMVRYLGAGAGSDAFVTAFKIPSSLRKIFAEGALSAAFLPSFVSALRKKESDAYSLMSLAFVLFEGSLLVLCGIIMIFAPTIIGFIAPGFSAEQVALTVPLVRILMPFIFFISSSALLAGALQAVGNFFVPAFGPILLNIVFIFGLLICWFLQLPVAYLCFFILFGGFLQFVQHILAYFKLNFSFGRITTHTWHSFSGILAKFFMCLLSMSVMEINLFIDTSFASYLPVGNITLIYYANRFMGIPLGVFAVAFSTILLPHFSRIGTYAPKRLNFYLLESAKLIFWVTLPCTLAMIFFADKIFTTLFLSDFFSLQQAHEAGAILTAFVIGLFFFAYNKIILNIYYAMHETKIPSIISILSTFVNIILNFVLMGLLKAPGLALATTIAGIIQTGLLLYYLNRSFAIHGYFYQFFRFAIRYSFQVVAMGTVFLLLYYGGQHLLATQAPQPIAHFFLDKIGFWLWAGPLCLLAGLLLYLYSGLFGVRLYFLD